MLSIDHDWTDVIYDDSSDLSCGFGWCDHNSFGYFFILLFYCSTLYRVYFWILGQLKKGSYSNEDSWKFHILKPQNLTSLIFCLDLLCFITLLVGRRILFFLHSLFARTTIFWRVCCLIYILGLHADFFQFLFLLHKRIPHLKRSHDMVLWQDWVIRYDSNTIQTHGKIPFGHNNICKSYHYVWKDS